MKLLNCIIIFIICTSSSIFRTYKEYDYFENDIGCYFIPQKYTRIEINTDFLHTMYMLKDIKAISLKNNNEIYNIIYFYPDSSYIFIGKGNYGDLKVTEICCDTIRDLNNNYTYDYWGKLNYKVKRSNSFPSTEGSILTYDHKYTGQVLTDWYYDILTKTYRKQIVVGAIEYFYGYHTAGYLCKNPQDTIKFNKALDLIKWKYNTNDKHKMKSLYFPFEIVED